MTMSYRFPLTLLLVPLVACLDTPPPSSADAGGSATDDDASTRIDASLIDASPIDAAPTTDALPPQAMEFPPIGWTVDIIGGAVVDMNDDDIHDLLLFNRDATNPSREGIFVLLGRMGEPIGPVYHAHIDTGVIPRAVIQYPFSTNDSLGDLIVLGDSSTDSNLYLEGYTNSLSLDFTATPRKQLNTQPFAASEYRESFWLSHGRFSGASFDLLIGAGKYFAVMPFSWWDAGFPNNIATQWTIIDTGIPSEVRAAYPVSTGNVGYDDLVLAQIGKVTWFSNDGDGNFGQSYDIPYGELGCEQPWMFMLDSAQVDLAGAPDLIGQCGKDVGALVVSPQTSSHIFTGNFAFGDSSIWIDVKVVHRPNDIDERPDILLMRGNDTCVNPGPVSLQMMTNLRDEQGTLVGGLPPRADLADGCPTDLLIGDFDGDYTEQAMVIHATGPGECYDIAESGLLPCDE
jgi:hypothetical protein